MGVVIAVVVVVVLLALLGFGLAVRIVRQYEQGVLFRLGRLRGARAPGLNLVIPGVDVLRRVSLRVVTMPSGASTSALGSADPRPPPWPALVADSRFW